MKTLSIHDNEGKIGNSTVRTYYVDKHGNELTKEEWVEYLKEQAKKAKKCQQ